MRGARRGMVLVIAVAIVSTAMSACAVPRAAHSTHPVPAGALSTQVKTYTPYAVTGTVTVPVAAIHRSGSCWTGSITVPKPGVYRCLIGNQIADPCFASTDSAQSGAGARVLCAIDPWTQATVVDLTAPLPHVAEPSGSQLGQLGQFGPWALELSNGAHCVLITGTVAQVGSVALNYGCEMSAAAGSTSGVAAGSAAGVRAGAGRLTATGTLMSVQYSPTSDGPLQTVTVTTAWTA